VTATPTFLASGYSGLVNSIGIVGNKGFFAMDDFTYHLVPEPSTLALGWFVTIATLICGRRRRKTPR
jgi:hypothetical protein